MSRLTAKREMNSQTLMFDEIIWRDDPPPSGGLSVGNFNVRGTPAGATSGMAADTAHPPYWEFDAELNTTSGITLRNVVVRDSQSAGSTENVFDFIDFTDFKIFFDDGTDADFDLQSAFSNPASRFEKRENGSRFTVTPNDPLFQRGLKLTLVDTVMQGGLPVCDMRVVISVVFRGANNDFDPGGVPVAMICWPQIGYTWNQTTQITPLLPKRVIKLRGSVRHQVNNRMHHGHGGHPALMSNVANFFTDSNTSMRGNQRGNILTGRTIRNTGSVIGSSLGFGGPIGWGLVFDYVKLDITREEQIVAVWDSQLRPTGTTHNYIWPAPSMLPNTTFSSANIELGKADRQAHYDNIHLHARMNNLDSCQNVQIHAPFCGHSCVHMHWRWSSISSNGASGGRGWQYKGWSRNRAHALDNAPLVPHNQRITVALCRPNATRHNDNSIIDVTAPQGQGLNTLQKLIWYESEIHAPNMGEQQVIMEHGIGWAYRYSNDSESSAVDGLTDIIGDDLPWTGTPTQHQISDFFENQVYPFFRYIDGLNCINQVPDSSYNNSFPLGSPQMKDVFPT